jgi:hypothetical protein
MLGVIMCDDEIEAHKAGLLIWDGPHLIGFGAKRTQKAFLQIG